MNSDRIVEAALTALPSAIRSRVLVDPIAALESLGLSVRAVKSLSERRDEGGACDGMSFLDDGVVIYAPTPWSKRENFTLAHELAHWLIDQDDHSLDLIADHDEPLKFLELLCDRIAQRLLLPDDALANLGSGAIRAHDVLELYRRTGASRPVCAIALAQRLPGLGAITIIDGDSREVTTASIHPDPNQGWPKVFPWGGQTIPAGHHLVTLTPGQTQTRKSFWRTPWGAHQDYYIDAYHDGQRIIAVFADTDLWNCEKAHFDAPRDFDTRPQQRISCCGQTRTVRGYPCNTCHEIACATCQRCRCDRQADRETMCSGCFTLYMSHLIIDGLCATCRN